MKKKIVSAMLIAAMATSMFAGCGSSASSNSTTTGTASTEASTEGSVSTSDGSSTLRINLASEPDKLDPALNTTVDGAALAANSFVGLFTFLTRTTIRSRLWYLTIP